MFIITLLLFELVALIAAASVGALILAYSMRNSEVFEFLVHSVGFFAFYHCFKVRSEKSVEKELAGRQESLNSWLKWRDEIRHRVDHPISAEEVKSNQELLAKRELEILERRRKLDYGIAVAYLAGFGKIARKFTK